MKNSRNISSAIVILSISFLSYFNTFANSFHFDDYTYILYNEAFKEHIHRSFSVRETFSNLSNRSIVLATLQLNHYLDEFNVFGFHVVNLTFHILTCLLIFFLAKETLFFNRFIKINYRSKSNLNIPLTAALLFAVHPINIQSVTYITGRTTSLAVCFYIASFLLFIKGIRQNLPYKILFFIMSIVFLVVGYGSKMIILTAPVMFIIYYLFFIPQNSLFSKAAFLKRFIESRFARIIIQAFIISSPFILIFVSRYLNFKADIQDTNSWLHLIFPQIVISKLSHIASLAKVSSSIYLLTEFKVTVFYYIKMIFFPFNQNIDPDFPIAHGITDPGVILSLSIILLCLFAGIYYYKKNRLIAFGVFWFFITLSLTSSVIPLRDMVTEHRLYLPLAGTIVIIPVFLNLLISNNKKSSLKRLSYFILLVFFPIIVFSILTVKRNFVWKDEKSLWSDAAEKSPRLSRPLNNLAEAYDKIGLAYGDKKKYEKAIQALNKAISISPTGYKYYNNIGKIYGRLGQFDPAIENLKLALKYNPDYPTAHYNMGKVYELKGMLDSAIEEYAAAFKQQYDFFEACFNLANVYDKKGQYRKAIDTYMNCLKFKSTYPKTYFAIGNVFSKTGKLDKAFEYYSRAVELDMNYFLAKIAMGNILVMKGNFDEAAKVYLQVIESDPSNFNAHNNLGLLYLQLNNPTQADYHFKKSIEIDSGQKQVLLLLKSIIEIQKSVNH